MSDEVFVSLDGVGKKFCAIWDALSMGLLDIIDLW
jgi:hypothetical protein